jgi:hypothetical protein
MLLNDPASKLAETILVKKGELEAQGKKPRLVLIDEDSFKLLEENWLEAVTALPWGDTLAYELRMRRARSGTIFLGDGSLFGLWVVRVNTIEGFQVF